MKKVISLFVSAALLALLATGCGTAAAATGEFDANTPVTVVSREDGSGTRSAFVELAGIEQEDSEGNKVDKTSPDAVTVASTSVVLTTVAGNPYAIGYVSLGSLNETVRALAIDGVFPSAETVADGSYPIARPFNLATGEAPSEAAQDFIAYILSAEGQAVVAENGYIPLEDAPAYAGTKPEGKVVVAGSSSVTPVMEKLKEAYQAVNPGAEVEIQMSDSSTGMSAVADGLCDIGMASRELKDSELAAGLAPVVMAMDGIAVVVNHQNPVEGLSLEQLAAIFTGEAAAWSDSIGAVE